MPEISDTLRLLYETSVEDEGDRYTVAIPKELVENGSIDTDTSYRVALLAAAANDPTPQDPETGERAPVSQPEPAPSPSHSQGPPVEEGEVRTVSIDTL